MSRMTRASSSSTASICDDCRSITPIGGIRICVGFAVSSANASLLSVNFETGVGFDLSQISPGNSAGVVPTTSWNNLVNDSGTTTVTDDAANNYSLTWAAGGGWQTTPNNGAGKPTSDGNSQLMFNAISVSNPTTFTVSGLSPTSTYNVFVYIPAVDVSTTQNILGTTTYYSSYNAASNWTTSDGGSHYTFTGFSQVTSTSSSNYQEGNYVEYTGVSRPSITFDSKNISGQSGIAGFQIQTVVPEPGSFALAAVGSLSMLARRRRAQ